MVDSWLSLPRTVDLSGRRVVLIDTHPTESVTLEGGVSHVQPREIKGDADARYGTWASLLYI
jgi:hypothetical protein